MELFVEMEVFDTIVRDEDIKRVRERFGAQLKKIMASGMVVTSGFFAEKRGGFLILNVNSNEEVVELLGTLIESFRIKIHPVMPLEKVPELFTKELSL
jgi:hypothetical protein